MENDLKRRLDDLERRQRQSDAQLSQTFSKVEDLHDLFLKKPVTGKPPLAENIQEIVSVYSSAKWSARAMLWLFGFVAAAATAWAALRGWFVPGGKG